MRDREKERIYPQATKLKSYIEKDRKKERIYIEATKPKRDI